MNGGSNLGIGEFQVLDFLVHLYLFHFYPAFLTITFTGWQVSSISNGTRSSSARAYLLPFIDERKNLDVLLNTRVARVVPDTDNEGENLSIHTIEIVSSPEDSPLSLQARSELIISAGSIGTPQILLLSGKYGFYTFGSTYLTSGV
jgi:choline dehydrogenase-like flavoprotein